MLIYSSFKRVTDGWVLFRRTKHLHLSSTSSPTQFASGTTTYLPMAMVQKSPLNIRSYNKSYKYVLIKRRVNKKLRKKNKKFSKAIYNFPNELYLWKLSSIFLFKLRVMFSYFFLNFPTNILVLNFSLSFYILHIIFCLDFLFLNEKKNFLNEFCL